MADGPACGEAGLVFVYKKRKNPANPMRQNLRSQFGIIVDQGDRSVITRVTAITFLVQ